MMEDVGIKIENIEASMGEALAILPFKCEALALCALLLVLLRLMMHGDSGPWRLAYAFPNFANF